MSMSGKKQVNKNGTSGLTLLEVLIAMTIMSITLVALSRSQSQSLSITGESRSMTTVLMLAQNKMAEIESKNPLDNMNDSGDFGNDYPDFSWKVKVSNSEIPHLKKVEVFISDKRKLQKEDGFQLVLYKYSG